MAPKVIRKNSQAKGPDLDDTLENDRPPTKQLRMKGSSGNSLYTEESFR